jgi:HAD superfamily hydrolase (TIGR01509 family)
MNNSKIKIVLFDFSYTLLFPKNDESINSLNNKYDELRQSQTTYNPLADFIINREMLEFIHSLKSDYKVYIFTSGHMHTDPTIQPILTPIFDGFFTTTQIQTPKSHPNAFKIIANHLGVETKQMLFVDDQEKNVQAAITAGNQAVRFTNNTETINKLKQLLNFREV